jgi:hypothetical protein
MPYDFDRVIDRRSTESNKWHKFPPDVLPLWVADMDFPSPEPVIRALRERVEHGFFGYGADQPEFFDKALAELRSNDTATAARARRLLERYVPTGPETGAANEWSAWWKENRPYAFATDAGDYRWYIDPLAKKRHMASADLRGPRRADPATQSAADRQ